MIKKMFGFGTLESLLKVFTKTLSKLEKFISNTEIELNELEQTITTKRTEVTQAKEIVSNFQKLLNVKE